MNKTIEELSIALDQLNCGQTVESEDQEINDLLEVATLLRNANLPVQPPEHLLTASVNQAAAGLAAHKTSRRSPWLYSGLLGAAAALLVFVGIHGFPSIQDAVHQTTPPLQSTPNSAPASVIKQTTPTEKSEPQSIVVTAPELPTPAPHRAAAPDKQGTAPPPGVTPTPSPAANRQPVQPSPEPRAELAALPPATRSTPAANPSLKSALAPSSPAEKAMPENPASLPILHLPGRTPDSITKDIVNGSIRQIFNSGTPQELIITQSRLPQMEKDTARKYSVGTANLNKLVVTINDQEVTLEGRQTSEELAALAKLLKP